MNLKDFLKSIASWMFVVGLLVGWVYTRWPAFLYFYGLLITIATIAMAMIPFGAYLAIRSNSDNIVKVLKGAKGMVDTMNKQSIPFKMWAWVNVLGYVSFFIYYNLFVLLTIFLVYHTLVFCIRWAARTWIKGVEAAAAEDGMTLEVAFKKMEEEAA
jgi:hypothetical protein